MGLRKVVIGGVGLMLFACAAGLPRAASAAECNAFVQLTYVSGPMPAVPGNTLRVRLTLFTGSITGGTLNQLTVKRLRFDLDCSSDSAVGLTCTDDGSVIQYEGNITSTQCFDASSNAVTFADNSAAGNFNPNEVIFTPSANVILGDSTPIAAGCQIEFDVQVASYSNDFNSPDDIEQVGGYKLGPPNHDADCDNGLSTTASQSSSIPLVLPTATPTNTPTSTNTPTNTPVPPTSTPTNTPTNTPVGPTNTPTNTPSPTNTSSAPTSTPTNSPTPCTGPDCCPTGDGGKIPGYCHSNEMNDCLSEVCSYAVPPAGGNVLHPSNTLTCKEGDPNCDFGPAGDGICTFKISLCFNVTDTRFPCVSADKVSRIHFTDPAESHPRTGIETENRDALEAALIGLGGTVTQGVNRSIAFTPSLTTADICTSALLIKVPLIHTGLGLRKGHSAIRDRVFPNASDIHATDRDRLNLICTP